MTNAHLYNVQAWGSRGTALIADADHPSKVRAAAQFRELAAKHVTDRDVCVLLTRLTRPGGGVVLASKNTSDDRVMFHAAYYRRAGADR